MKQVLFVNAGHRLPKGPLAFLNGMQQQERIHAKGLFFRAIDYATLARATGALSLMPVMDYEDQEKDNVASLKDDFAGWCGQKYIQYDIHGNDLEWNKDLLIKESRFADLLVISGELFYNESDPGQPNTYLREALHGAECPVLIVPENYSSADHLYMAYDGSRESIFAIKQFCQLFPQLTDLPTEILYVKEEPGNNIPDIGNLQQFTRNKFSCMSFSKLHFKAADYFSTWISEKKNVLLVCGSFSHSLFHYATRRSFAEAIIHEHQLPVFIAHP